MSAMYGSAAGSDTSSGDYFRLEQQITTNIQKLVQNVSSMQRMVQQLGTQSDSQQLRDRLHQTCHYANQLAKDTGDQLRRLSGQSSAESASEQRQRKLQRERLTGEFSTALSNLQSTQRRAAEKERASVERVRAHSTGREDSFMIPASTSDEQLIDVKQPQAQDMLQVEENVDLDLLHEREQAIQQLESDITDVNTIFKDLGVLVHEQGEVITSIEANVESATGNVENATEQLRIAKNYQSKSRRKKLCLLAVLIVAIAIIALIIYFSVRKN